MAKHGRWVKLYVKILYDAEMRRLTCTQKWIFVTLLLLADEGDGTISGATADPSHIAFGAGSDRRVVEKSLEIYREIPLISIENGIIKILNWHKYQSLTAERDERRERQNAALEVDKNRIDKNREDIYREIYDFWNSFPELPTHKKLTNSIKGGINARLDEGYTKKDIKTVIENYVKSTDQFWVEQRKKKLWTLGEFLSRKEGKNLERFKQPIMDKNKVAEDEKEKRIERLRGLPERG